MSRLHKSLAGAVLAVGLIVGIGLLKKDTDQAPSATPEARVPAGPTPAPPAGPTIGEEVLTGYADPARTPRHDLELVSRLVHSYRALVKRHTAKPIGGNADLVEALLGDNPAKQVFLPAGFAHLSPGPDAELLDRWRTPLVVHPVASDRYELRSAGPDRQPYTEDDILLTPSAPPSSPTLPPARREAP